MRRLLSFVRRAVAVSLLLLLFLPTLASCRTGEGTRAEIVCTVYPIYDWVLAVLGDRVEEHPVRLLSDNGNDPHNYQPSVRDLTEIAECELFLYVGGVSDAWADELIDAGTRRVALIDAVEVCEDEHAHGHSHDEEHRHAHEHGAYDEHIWLSLVNAADAVEEICRSLCALYADDAETVADFRANADAYLARLSELDARYREVVARAALDTVLVCDRFPFLYLMRDYGLSYHAAFPGCSAEVDASFGVVVELAEELRTLGLSTVIVTETGDRDLAETVIRASGVTDVEILTLHSCQSVTKEERAAGVTYLSIMENNLSVLTRALTP